MLLSAPRCPAWRLPDRKPSIAGLQKCRSVLSQKSCSQATLHLIEPSYRSTIVARCIQRSSQVVRSSGSLAALSGCLAGTSIPSPQCSYWVSIGPADGVGSLLNDRGDLAGRLRVLRPTCLASQFRAVQLDTCAFWSRLTRSRVSLLIQTVIRRLDPALLISCS